MPAVLGSLEAPQLSAPPSSPVRGELYYDTTADILYWWNGTQWVASGSAGGTTPSGPAGGDLSGTYPDPQLGAGVVGNAELATDAVDSSKIAAGSIVDADVNAAAAILGRKLQWSRGTTPPASPTDNDLWLYDGSGYSWLFVYDSSEATHKWKCIGGGSLWTQTSAAISGTSGSVWSFYTGGLTLTIPRSGLWEIYWTCRGQHSTTGGVGQLGAGIGVNSTSSPSVPGHMVSTACANNAYVDLSSAMILNATAGDIIRQLTWQQTASACPFDNRGLWLKPIQVS